MRIDHHIVPKMLDVVNQVIDAGVVVEDQGCELSWKLTIQDLFRERGVKDSGAASFDPLQKFSLASLIRLWINSSRALMLGDSLILLQDWL